MIRSYGIGLSLGMLIAGMLASQPALCGEVPDPPHPPVFLFDFGSKGTGEGQFFLNYDITVDDSTNLYVTDFNVKRVQKFSRDGTFVKQWGVEGTGPGEFSRVYGIDYGPNGFLYTADFENNRIQKFDTDGQYVAEWTVPSPLALAVHPKGKIYVQDRTDNSIKVFDDVGNFEFQFSGIEVPSSIGFIEIDFRGVVYTTGPFAGEVEKFTEDGSFLGFVGTPGTGPGELDRAMGISTDKHGNLYVPEWENHRVSVFDSSGAFLTMWGKEGKGPGQFGLLLAAEWTSGDTVYTLDRDSARVTAFEMGNIPPVVQVTSIVDGEHVDPGDMVPIEWEAHDDEMVLTIDLDYVTDEKLLVANTPGLEGTPSELYEIDPETGAGSGIGPIGFNYVLAMDTDPLTGVLYAVGERQSDSTQVLLTIDPNTGEGTEIGPTCLEEPIGDLAFDEESHTLYGVSQILGTPVDIYTFNLVTGQAVLLGSTLDEGFYPSLEFDPNGTLKLTMLIMGNSYIYDVSTNTGEAFDYVQISEPPAYTNNLAIHDLDRKKYSQPAHCLYRDNTTLIRLGVLNMNTSPPILADVGPSVIFGTALSWHPGQAIPIDRGLPNTGSFVWTVPDIPTNRGRIKVTARDNEGATSFDFSDGYYAIINTTDAPAGAERGLFLAAPRPNPSRGSVSIRFGLPKKAEVELAIYDVRGRLVRRLIDGEREAGEYSLTWDGRNASGVRVASGHYYLRLSTPNSSRTTRVQIVR